MSFGWSAGDIASAVRLGFIIIDALRDSGGSTEQRNKAHAFLQIYNEAIWLVEQCYAEKGVDAAGKVIVDDKRLGPALTTLKRLYDNLADNLKDYNKLEKKDGEKPWDFVNRQGLKLKWTFFAKDAVQDIRSQIIGQMSVIQPILTHRLFSRVSNQSASQHEETTESLESVKDMLRFIVRQLATNHAQILPMIGPAEGIASTTPTTPSPPSEFLPYNEARTRISPYVPRGMTNETSAALKKLKGDAKILRVLRTWLLHSDSESTSSEADEKTNCLWLLNPSATQVSAIMYNVGTTEAHIPVLAYSCRQVDSSGDDIPTHTLFTQLLYAFLDGLLGHLSTSPSAARRIDSPGFESLDGTYATAGQAIILIGNLLDNVSSACVCIIDNFHRLDTRNDAQTTALLQDFLGLFKQSSGRPSAHYTGRHKLLLTTRGMTEMLADKFRDGELDRLKTDEHLGKGRYLIWEELKVACQATLQ